MHGIACASAFYCHFVSVKEECVRECRAFRFLRHANLSFDNASLPLPMPVADNTPADVILHRLVAVMTESRAAMAWRVYGKVEALAVARKSNLPTFLPALL
jgi:hypothetical protein